MPEDVGGLVKVARARDLFEARLMAGFLESHDIPVRLPDETIVGAYDGAAAIWTEGVVIEVPAGRAEEARRLLAERESGLDESGG